MDIIANTEFKHGRMKFEKGKAYQVPEAIGGYFVGVGWASPHDGRGAQVVPADRLDPNAPPPKRKGSTLEVQDINLKLEG